MSMVLLIGLTMVSSAAGDVPLHARPGESRPTAHHARIALVTKGGASADSWTELVVIGTPADAVPLCTAFVQSEVDRFPSAQTGLRPVVNHPCQTAPLPIPPAGTSAEYALIHEYSLNPSDALLLQQTDQRLMQRAGRVRALKRHVSLYPSPDTCDAQRQLLQEGERQAVRQSEEAARSWLEDQTAAMHRKTLAACKLAEELAKRCGPQGSTVCVEAERADRECELNRKLQQALESRLEAQRLRAAEPPLENPPECIPARALAMYSLLAEQPGVGVDLLAPLVEAVARAEVLNRRYNVKHPRWQAAHEHISALVEQARAAPRDDGTTTHKMVEHLERLLHDEARDRAELLTRYGKNHPRFGSLDAQRRSYLRWRALLK